MVKGRDLRTFRRSIAMSPTISVRSADGWVDHPQHSAALIDVAAKQAGGAKKFPALHPAHVSDLVLSVVPPCSCGFRIDRTISAPSRHASPHLRRARQRQ